MDLREKEVHQYTLEGDFVSKYKSVSLASSLTGVSKTCIAKVCRGERDQSGGFKWTYNK